MSLVDVEKGLRALLLDRDEHLMEGPPPDRQRLYRRLVRSNLFSAVRRAIPITRKILGEDGADALIAQFLDEVGPKTRLVRNVAGEFAEWLMQKPDLPHPACGELAHWEVVEIDVGLAPDYDGPAYPRTPTPSSTIETHPSARLAAYRHRVHALTMAATAYPEAESEPTILLAWRSGERFFWQTLEGGVAKVLVECAQGSSLSDAFASVTAALAEGDTFDSARVNAHLVDLCRRGALVGFRAPSV
ncbi:MAG TPA: putative DNA-binding domain-containing protein [Myxococcota bacterium]|jgi:hypothetical protein